jgi:hypothetical protein
MQAPSTKTVFTIAAAAAGAIVLYKLADFLGLIKSKEQKEAEANENKLVTGASADINKVDLNNGSLALSPNYYYTIYKKIQSDYKKAGKSAPKASSFLGPYKYAELATNVWDSKGTFNDQEDKLYGVFTQLQSQLQISFLSNLFYKIYKRDLLNFILNFTNTEERAQLYTIIKNKKLY